MQGKRPTRAARTPRSTVAVALRGREAAVRAPAKPAETGFWAGLKGGWNAFLATLQVLLEILGALLPFILAIGLPVLLVLWLLRRRRQSAPQPAAPSLAPSPWPAGSAPLPKAPPAPAGPPAPSVR